MLRIRVVVSEVGCFGQCAGASLFLCCGRVQLVSARESGEARSAARTRSR